MDFRGGPTRTAPCVAFLHRDLILRSPGLLFAAFFATVAAGVAAEGLAAAAGAGEPSSQDAACLDGQPVGGNPVAVSMALKTQALLLYGTQCSAGYLLMLVSMTPTAPCCSWGSCSALVLGHAWFNAAAPMGARRRAACCQHVAAELGPDRRAGGPTSRLEDEHPDGGSSGSGGSVDDHSSLDSLNKALIARPGSGRRGWSHHTAPGRARVRVGPQRKFTSRVLRRRVSPSHARGRGFTSSASSTAFATLPPPYVPERLAEPRALVLAEPGLRARRRASLDPLAACFRRRGKRRQHAGSAPSSVNIAWPSSPWRFCAAAWSRSCAAAPPRPRRPVAPALPGFTPTSSLSPD